MCKIHSYTLIKNDIQLAKNLSRCELLTFMQFGTSIKRLAYLGHRAPRESSENQRICRKNCEP